MRNEREFEFTYETGQRRQWHPTPVRLPGKSHGWRSLVSCSPWGHEESDTTEQLHFHFSLSCFGEGNGNRLQCSCLENPRDGGAWWAAVYGVAQSQTWLKRLSSSSSMGLEFLILFGSAWTFLHIVSMMTSNRFGFKSSGCLPYKLQKVTYLFHWFENINIKYIT